MFCKKIFATIATVAALSFAGVSGASAAVYDRHVVLINDSHKTIMEFHASNVSRGTWEDDILGEDVLSSGDAIRINLDDDSGYCRFDFLTVMTDGTRLVRRNVDVCTVDRYTITD